MSRSYRKTPIYGVCGHSEKDDKKLWHGRFRSKEKQRLKRIDDLEEFIPLTENDVSSLWDMAKDGKMYWPWKDQIRWEKETEDWKNLSFRAYRFKFK